MCYSTQLQKKFTVSTVPADVLAPLHSWTSAEIVIMVDPLWVYMLSHYDIDVVQSCYIMVWYHDKFWKFNRLRTHPLRWDVWVVHCQYFEENLQFCKRLHYVTNISVQASGASTVELLQTCTLFINHLSQHTQGIVSYQFISVYLSSNRPISQFPARPL